MEFCQRNEVRRRRVTGDPAAGYIQTTNPFVVVSATLAASSAVAVAVHQLQVVAQKVPLN